jgi:Ion channel
VSTLASKLSSWKAILVSWLLVLLSVVLFVLFRTAIRSAWPLAPLPEHDRHPVPIAILFWVVLATAFLIFLLRDAGKGIADFLQKRAEKRGLQNTGEPSKKRLCGLLLGDWYLAESGHFLLAFVLAALGIVSLYSAKIPFLAGSGGAARIEAIVTVAFVDIYTVLLIWTAAGIGSNPRDKERWPGLPSREVALFVVLLMFAGLITAFGHIYAAHGNVMGKNGALSCPSDALYFSFVTITTLGYGDYAPTGNARYWVMLQLVSMVLFVLMAFPVLASRLADFGDSSETRILEISTTDTGLKITGLDGGELQTTTPVKISVSRLATVERAIDE